MNFCYKIYSEFCRLWRLPALPALKKSKSLLLSLQKNYKLMRFWLQNWIKKMTDAHKNIAVTITGAVCQTFTKPSNTLVLKKGELERSLYKIVTKIVPLLAP